MPTLCPQAAVDLLEGLLRYDGQRRLRHLASDFERCAMVHAYVLQREGCDRALREMAFFASEEPEAKPF